MLNFFIVCVEFMLNGWRLVWRSFVLFLLGEMVLGLLNFLFVSFLEFVLVSFLNIMLLEEKFFCIEDDIWDLVFDNIFMNVS